MNTKINTSIKISTMPATAFALTVLFSCNNTTTETTRNMTFQWPKNITAPVADKKPKTLIAHGDTRIDNYFWMNDYFKKGPDSSNVVSYLTAENKYYDTMMSGTKDFQEKLYTEMKARIKEKDESVPYFKNGFYYYTRQVEGKDYYISCRKKANLQAAEDLDKALHGFAILSSIQLGKGLYHAISRKPTGAWLAFHYRWMTWSYTGLCAALIAESSTRIVMPYLRDHHAVRSFGWFWGILAAATFVVVATGQYLEKRNRGILKGYSEALRTRMEAP